jgi:hypothetical protein
MSMPVFDAGGLFAESNLGMSKPFEEDEISSIAEGSAGLPEVLIATWEMPSILGRTPVTINKAATVFDSKVGMNAFMVLGLWLEN